MRRVVKRIRSASPSNEEVPAAVQAEVVQVEDGKALDTADNNMTISTKRGSKPKGKKQTKKARLAVQDIELGEEILPPVAEIKIEPVKKAKIPKAPKVPKVPAKSARRAVTPPSDRFLAEARVEDDEDAYWLSQALAVAQDETAEPDFSSDEAEEEDTKHPLYHTAGAWRAEG